MMAEKLNPVPPPSAVLREQVAVVGRSLRLEGLIAAVFVGVTVVASFWHLARGENMRQWFDGGDWVPLGLIAFLVPLAVWRRERRFSPAFLWTLPVDRCRLALHKVAAGWIWLMAALALVVAWLLLLGRLSGFTVGDSLGLVAVPFTGATIGYLFGSAFTLALRHPARWVLALFGALFFVSYFSERLGAFEALTGPALGSAIDSALVAWSRRPDLSRWTVVTLLWLGAGLAALLAAASRHREHRRR